jgi:TctA family transporter
MTADLIRRAQLGMELGDPITAGRSIASIISFMMQRTPAEKRESFMDNLRRKIWAINTADIAGKRTSDSAAIAQSITFIKTILRGHHPAYIREVLKYILMYLY